MLQIKPVSRGDNRSATACAAYRSGTEIKCEREGVVHDYTRKSGIYKSDSMIILPNGSTAEWASDRSVLWNAAEAAEKRKDGRVAREYVIALPNEVTPAERKELAIELSRYIADRYQVAVDLNLHAPHIIDGVSNGNYHAHLLSTTRKITPDGFAGKSDVELSDSDRKKYGLERSKDEVLDLRQQWAFIQNKVLEKHGVQVSAASLESQNLDREATFHMGPALTNLERKGKKTALGDLNREIDARNRAREEELRILLDGFESPLALEQEIIVTRNLLSELMLEEEQEAAQLAAQQQRKLVEKTRMEADIRAMQEMVQAKLNAPFVPPPTVDPAEEQRKAWIAKMQAFPIKEPPHGWDVKKSQTLRDRLIRLTDDGKIPQTWLIPAVFERLTHVEQSYGGLLEGVIEAAEQLMLHPEEDLLDDIIRQTLDRLHLTKLLGFGESKTWPDSPSAVDNVQAAPEPSRIALEPAKVAPVEQKKDDYKPSSPSDDFF
jgi:hypothetical protein